MRHIKAERSSTSGANSTLRRLQTHTHTHIFAHTHTYTNNYFAIHIFLSLEQLLMNIHQYSNRSVLQPYFCPSWRSHASLVTLCFCFIKISSSSMVFVKVCSCVCEVFLPLCPLSVHLLSLRADETTAPGVVAVQVFACRWQQRHGAHVCSGVWCLHCWTAAVHWCSLVLLLNINMVQTWSGV